VIKISKKNITSSAVSVTQKKFYSPNSLVSKQILIGLINMLIIKEKNIRIFQINLIPELG